MIREGKGIYYFNNGDIYILNTIKIPVPQDTGIFYDLFIFCFFFNEKLNLKKIEEGLTNALTNDSYFRDEINKIAKGYARLVEKGKMTQEQVDGILASITPGLKEV